MGLLEVLTVIFVVLKLFEVIDWSWWLVFSPMYVYVGLFLLWLSFAFFVGIAEGIHDAQNKRKKK